LPDHALHCLKIKSYASIATKKKRKKSTGLYKMPPKKKKTVKKGGFLPLLMLPGGLMGMAALMKATGGNVTGGRRKR
jgi:hypothetical protein